MQPPAPTSGLSAILQVATQELRTSLRDRQTVVNSVVLPIVMYPILFWVIMQGLLVVQGHKERTQVKVALVGDASQVEAFQRDSLALLAEHPDALIYLVEQPPETEDAYLRKWLQWVDSDEADDSTASVLPVPDAILRLPQDAPTDVVPADSEGQTTLGTTESESTPAVATLFVESTRSRSELAGERVRKLAAGMSTQLREDAANALNLTKEDLDPLNVRTHSITAERDKGAFILSLFLPMMIIFMAVMGSFFPAVDSTAGEKERGTAETTLLLPIPREHVLLGKILSTTTLAFVATILNLAFMGLAARHLLGTLGPKVPFEIEFPFLALLYSLPLILLFCFFVAAVLTALAGLTKSFKEGQAMLGPAQMVFILPAVIGVMPGLKLSVGWALVPVINVVLAVRSILVMEWLPIPYLVTALALCVSAWLAVRLCVRLLSQEALAFAGSSMSFKDLLRKRSHAKS